MKNEGGKRRGGWGREEEEEEDEEQVNNKVAYTAFGRRDLVMMAESWPTGWRRQNRTNIGQLRCHCILEARLRMQCQNGHTVDPSSQTRTPEDSLKESIASPKYENLYKK